MRFSFCDDANSIYHQQLPLPHLSRRDADELALHRVEAVRSAPIVLADLDLRVKPRLKKLIVHTQDERAQAGVAHTCIPTRAGHIVNIVTGIRRFRIQQVLDTSGYRQVFDPCVSR